MNRKNVLTIGIAAVGLTVLGVSAQDKYTLKVPGGLAFSEFRGYESWQVVSTSMDGNLIAAILANPMMIQAYLAGVPSNGKPFPDGAKMAKIHWNPKKMEVFPAAIVPGTQHDVDFMVKDSKRFADSGGCIRSLHTRHFSGQAAAREQRQVRVRLPYDGQNQRLRFHGLRASVKRANDLTQTAYSKRATGDRGIGRNPFR